MTISEEVYQFFSAEDLYLFHEGTHFRSYEKFGAHLEKVDGRLGVRFGLWAPAAESVSVIGDFNDWKVGAHPLTRQGASGVWAGFVPKVSDGAKYKFHIQNGKFQTDRTDPYATQSEKPPGTASVVCDLHYEWRDQEWMATRGDRQNMERPIAIYELHLGSWRRAAEGNRSLMYREIPARLADYISQLGFTHVQLLPLLEHVIYESTGYEPSAFFAPTARYGTPQDLMYLVDVLHQRGIGVILDWPCAAFDAAALENFDGSPAFEGVAPQPPYARARVFDFSRPEVRSFLISSALFWIEKYHFDGLKIGDLSSLLYRGDRPKNRHHRKENLAGAEFLKLLNTKIYGECPGVQTFGEESAHWPLLSRPVYLGGLGFGYKVDTGFREEMLRYFSRDPLERKHYQHELAYRPQYAFAENHLLAWSESSSTGPRRSLLSVMPGDEWQKFANLRLLLGYTYMQPGKKLLFMGNEFGHLKDWDPRGALEWESAARPFQTGVQNWVTDLNARYREHAALHQTDAHAPGFEWIDFHDAEQSVLSWIRWDKAYQTVALIVCNFTPMPRRNYRIGAPRGGAWREILNSDAAHYGGSGQGNFGLTKAAPFEWHGRPYTLALTLPPLGLLTLFWEQNS